MCLSLKSQRSLAELKALCRALCGAVDKMQNKCTFAELNVLRILHLGSSSLMYAFHGYTITMLTFWETSQWLGKNIVWSTG